MTICGIISSVTNPISERPHKALQTPEAVLIVTEGSPMTTKHYSTDSTSKHAKSESPSLDCEVR